MNKGVIYQSFEWYTGKDIPLFQLLEKQAYELSQAGFTAIWLPPAYKGSQGIDDVGYGAYDLYDLGEFEAKGTIPTKYGNKDDYLKCMSALQQAGIQVYTDIVLNHKMGADGLELVNAKEVNPDNTEETITQTKEILAATVFTYPQRHGKYSTYTWNYTCFNGVDYDNNTNKSATYLFDGKTWNDQVDDESGNFDYLMGADLDFHNEEVVEECKTWGKWYYDTCHNDGFRLDAVKHISAFFYKDWVKELREYAQRDLFTVGEYWHGDIHHLLHYLEEVNYEFSLFDVPLHYHFYDASHSDHYDMSHIFDDTLVQSAPDHAVTFVDNHDTQPHQSLTSFVDEWFKKHAYTLILLREEGYPCVFSGDYLGIPHDDITSHKEMINELLLYRSMMSGERHDYFDDEDIIGWSYEGEEMNGFVVIMSHSSTGTKNMYVGEKYKDCLFTDGKYDILIDENGNGLFQVDTSSVNIYKLKEK